MERQRYKSDLWSQLKEAYAKAQYTYVTHQKQLWLVYLKQGIIGWFQIGFTAISTVGFLSIIFVNKDTLTWAAGICSVLSLALNLYSRSANLGEEIAKRRNTVDGLWPILQDYISLLTDFWYAGEIETIIQRRQELQDKTDAVYKDAPRTGFLAYQLAREALKKGKEQSFDGEESDLFLPENLRNRK